VFFRDNVKERKKVCSFWNLPEGRKTVLYAPTFRADHSTDCYALGAAALAEACGKRFGGDWSVLIRLHPNIGSKSVGLFPYDGNTIIDATAYPDMQELLIACDMLITDYSSSMFDFALSGKPCIQFALDLEDYQKDRGFYFPLDALPFPMVQSNGELCELIVNFDEEAQRQRWAAFAEENGFCEDGHAAERCARWILDKVKG
jgi:CDP-glycerol glycerophosphotransferase